jgi:hypothetical protein
VILSVWKARRTFAPSWRRGSTARKEPMKFNWLMVLPFALFLGIAGIWLWQLQNNQFALQQGVDTTALRSVQQGNPRPD